MVANRREDSRRYNPERIDILLKAQIENSIQVGWDTQDIVLLTNFDFEFMDVKAIQVDLNEFCLTGSKIFGLKWWFDNNEVEDIIWSKDLDCWQNIKFDCPEFEGDVGAVQYNNPKYNGGSTFWKPKSKDIIDEIVKRLSENKAEKEEPLLNKVFKSKEYRDRISVLNNTYNVGCSGFLPRYQKSIKPIHVNHFHPYNRIAWELHALDRKRIGEVAITVRLERLLRKYYPDLATELRDEISKFLKDTQ